MLTITATSGSAISASSAIWPAPRMPISSTRTSVPAGALRISSGIPISVLKFAREATVRLWGARTARSRSFVDVLPVEPVTPMTCAPSSRRQAVASLCRAFRGSSALRTTPVESARASGSACSGVVSTPQAPDSRAFAAKAPPSTFAPGRPTNRAPGPTTRESMVTNSRPPVCPNARATSAPAADATVSSVHCFIWWGSRRWKPFPAGSHARRSHRRTGSFCRLRTPGPARGPSRRSLRHHPRRL